MADATPIRPGPAPQPGLIWGFDPTATPPRTLDRCDNGDARALRWLHLNLADQGTRDWIMHADGFPPEIADLLLSQESHQRSLIEGGVVGCVLHDLERDFDVIDTARIGALRVVLTDRLIVTARHHPVRSADLIRDRVSRTPAVADPGAALEVIVATIAGIVAGLSRVLGTQVQTAEDRLLEEADAPTTRELIGIRRRLAQLHRLTDGMLGTMTRLEQDEALPAPLVATVEKLAQRLAGLAGDLAAIQLQLRLLREELDLQAAQRTNTNLYVLSIMTVLMLPATLVTGIFGMNTGGLPLAHGAFGTFGAVMLALGAAAGTWLVLRAMGLMRR